MGERVGAAVVALVIGILVVAVASGCGSGDDEATGQTLTRGEFIKEANAICQKQDKARAGAFEAFIEENGESNSPKYQEELTMDVALPPVKTQAEELAALEAPEGEEGTVGAMIKSLENGIQEVEADGAKALVGQNPFADFDKKAEAYGLNEYCSTL